MAGVPGRAGEGIIYGMNFGLGVCGGGGGVVRVL